MMISVTSILCSETHFSCPPAGNAYTFVWLPRSNHQIFQIPKKAPRIAALRVHLNNAFHVLKENLQDCELFKATNFHRFHLYLFKLFSPQLSDQTYADSLIVTLLLHPIIQYRLKTWLIKEPSENTGNYWAHLRLIILHWKLMLMMNSPLSNVMHWMITMQILTKFHRTLRLLHVKFRLHDSWSTSILSIHTTSWLTFF